MKKSVKIFLIVILVILLVGAAILAYLGFIPGISDKLVKRVDLGIENDPQLSIDLRNKVGVEFNIPESEWPTDKEVVYEGVLNIDETISSEQATSILNIVSAEIASMPFSNVQIRFNNDGTAEASFNLNIETTVNEARKLGYSEEEIEQGKKYLGVLGDSVYVYAKIAFDVTENNLSVTPYDFRIQNFYVPADITEMVAESGSKAIEERLAKVPNIDIKSLKQVGDKIQYTGTIPKSVSVKE